MYPLRKRKRLNKNRKKALEGRDRKTVSLSLWGWNVGTAIMGFIFSFLFLGFAIVPIFVKVLRPWLWIGGLTAAVLGLPMLILAMLWLFGSPGEDAPPLLSQGNYLGPYLCLLATLLVMFSGTLLGISGIKALTSGRKSTPTHPQPV